MSGISDSSYNWTHFLILKHLELQMPKEDTAVLNSSNILYAITLLEVLGSIQDLK